MRSAIQGLFLFVVIGTAALAAAQARPFPGPDVQQIYQRLLPQIEKIPAFDHHAHPGHADDPDVDAMAAPPNASEALRTRDDNPELAVAAKALFGYPYADLSPDRRLQASGGQARSLYSELMRNISTRAKASRTRSSPRVVR